MRAPPASPPASARRAVVARTHIPCDHTRRTALLLIGAPLVSGFASMAGCVDHDSAIQAMLSHSSVDLSGMDPSMLTCSLLASDDEFCAPEANTALVCAASCKYHGPCTGDGALAILFSDPDEPNDDSMKCADVADFEAIVNGYKSGTYTAADLAQMDWDPPTEEELGYMEILFPLARGMCGLPPARRARKMTDAAPVDASKAHKLAAAMLRSTKTMAHRLAQVAVSQPPRRAPPARLPARARARPSPPEHTL